MTIRSDRERGAAPVTWAELQAELSDIAMAIGWLADAMPPATGAELRGVIDLIGADPRQGLSVFLQRLRHYLPRHPPVPDGRRH